MTQAWRLLAFLLLFTPRTSCAQPYEKSLADLRSDVDSVRRRAFYSLLSAANPGKTHDPNLRDNDTTLIPLAKRDDRIASALIRLLEVEAARKDDGVGTEEFSEYFGDLISYVAALQDVRAVPALTAVIKTGNIAMQGLADLGEPALPSVMNALHSPDEMTRNAAIHTLGKFTEPDVSEHLSENSRSNVRHTILRALSDSLPFVRLAAVWQVRFWTDPGVEQTLNRIAASDPFVFGEGANRVYPVRANAKVALRLRARAKRQHDSTRTRAPDL